MNHPRPPARCDEAHPAQHPPLSSDTTPVAPPTILVADDDPIAQKLLATVLHGQGYHIIFAQDGLEALARAGALAPDLILLDVMMPKLDGLETCRRLRSDPTLAEVPILLITALDEREVRLEGISAGADDFLVKPFDRVELQMRVRTILRLNRYRKLVVERSQRKHAEDELEHYVKRLEDMVEQRTRELERERDRTQAILEAVGEAVIVGDVQGTVTYVNPAAERLHERLASEIVGRPWLALVDDQWAAHFCEGVAPRLHSGQIWSGETTVAPRGGAPVDVAMTIAPLFEPHTPQQLAGVVVVTRSIAPLKEAERMKNQFVSNVSHELRTPLSVVTLLSSSLHSLYDLIGDAQRRSMLHDICVSGQLLSDLINDILEIARIDSGRIEPERHMLDLAPLLCEEMAQQRALVEKKRLHVSIQAPRSLPILGNERQIRQVVRNLLNNAIKYTPEGGAIFCESALVRVPGPGLRAGPAPAEPPGAAPGDSSAGVEQWPGAAELPQGTWAGLRILDTGIGIAAADLPRLFQRFSRVSAEGTVSGTGLGLAIAQELTQRHHGFLKVSSQLGAGSCFALYVPLHD